MKENKKKEYAAVLVMLFVVCYGYRVFYNNAFTGYEARGSHIWLSASTVKFVNNWLKEGPLKLNFIMYERPDSIEFNSTAERGAYISYPPGAIIPPYILAKLLHKSEIQVIFIKQFLKIKFLFDTLLVCLIFYSIFRVTLRLTMCNTMVIASIVLTMMWMILPVNLYYLRNVYFADQCIITVVLFFILLEIYDEYFLKRPLVKYLYLGLKFIVSLYGILTDWYFIFVLFISWLVKIVPLIKSKDNFKKIVFASFVYVLPVLLGMGLYFMQIMHVPNYRSYVVEKIKFRTIARYGEISHIHTILNNFLLNIPYGLSLIVFFVIVTFIAKIKNKLFTKKYRSLLGIMTIIYVPPVFQVLVFQNHSAIHEFSMLKFALPVTLTIVILTVFILDLRRMSDTNIIIQIENDNDLRNIKIPLLYLIIFSSSALLCGILMMNKYYYQLRSGAPVSYERENLIRSNYSYSDVYFSFTESINANPPYYLAVSKKLIYKINTIPEIFERFPYLKHDARILLMVNKGNLDKSQQIVENEQAVIKTARLLFSSKNYDVYEIDRGHRITVH